MKSFLAFLVSDWRRKLVAIAIAFALWSWIESRLADYVDLRLTVAFTTEDIGTPDDFQLLIQAPPGWVLTDPPIGEPITIWMNGSKSQTQSFKARQCAAKFVASFIPPENENFAYVDALPEDLDWMRPGDAKLLLGKVSDERKELKQLVFERVKSATVALTPREIDTTGEPSEAHEVKTEELKFTPNTVTLTGPQAAVDSLLAQIDAAHSADGTADGSLLLNALAIPEGTRNDFNHGQVLNSRWKEKGIVMDPEEVFVEAKVRLKAPQTIQFFPKAEDVQVIPPTDPAMADAWELDWEANPWLVSMPHVENQELINTAWVQDHVRLFLPLQDLTFDGGLTTWKVRVEAHIVGLEDPIDQSFFEQHLIIGPEDGSDNDMITVKRKQ